MSELEKRISTYRGVCFSAALNEKNGSQLSIHKVISTKLAAVRPTHSCALAHCGQLQPNGLCVLGVDGVLICVLVCEFGPYNRMPHNLKAHIL